MTALVDTVLEIDTPEHLAFRARIAGPARRIFAWAIDFSARCVILLFASLIISVLFDSAGLRGLGQGLTLLWYFLLDWGYFVAWEVASGGRSLGKIAVKLRVVRDNGLPISWRESVLRNLLRAADLTVFSLYPPEILALGPVVMAFDGKFRRLGDLAAGTMVVVEEGAAVSAGAAPPVPEEALEALPAVLPLGREDLEALELFVHRRHMTEARREELARLVAPVFAGRLGMPPPENASAFLAALWAKSQRRGPELEPSAAPGTREAA